MLNGCVIFFNSSCVWKMQSIHIWTIVIVAAVATNEMVLQIYNCFEINYEKIFRLLQRLQSDPTWLTEIFKKLIPNFGNDSKNKYFIKSIVFINNQKNSCLFSSNLLFMTKICLLDSTDRLKSFFFTSVGVRIKKKFCVSTTILNTYTHTHIKRWNAKQWYNLRELNNAWAFYSFFGGN